MKVLIVCHDSTMSGANRSLYDWLKTRDRSNFKVICLIPRYNRDFLEAFKGIDCKVWIGLYSVPFHRLSSTSIVVKIKDFIKYIYSVIVNPFILSLLSKKVKKEGIKVIHSNSFATTFGCELAIKTKLPHIWHIREFMQDDYKIAHVKPERDDLYCRYSSAIFISPIIKQYYEKKYVFSNSVMIIDRIDYDATYHKSRVFMEDGICRILIAGVIAKHKGQIDAIRAVKRVKEEGFNVELIVCGQGDSSILKPYLDSSCDSYIHVLGYQKNLNRIRNKCDIALVCSEKEALGRVTIEGMLYKNLVIGADSGCTHFLIEDGLNGFLYKPKNIDSLKDQIEFAILHTANTKEIIQHAYNDSIDKFTNDISKRIMDFYSLTINLFKGKM
nr:glycosyltransferase family 4 protein [uncultured Lachnoclostridium sp.]